MRKPKTHPKYGINLVGISFRERWNIVEHATKEELETYSNNVKRIKEIKVLNEGTWWERKQKTVNESVQNTYLRKTWRVRHSKTFETDKIYRMDRHIQRYNTKLGPSTGEGYATSYQFERQRKHVLFEGDLVILTKRDEMGNLYFSKVSEITATHPYVFNRDNANLGYIVPVEA